MNAQFLKKLKDKAENLIVNKVSDPIEKELSGNTPTLDTSQQPEESNKSSKNKNSNTPSQNTTLQQTNAAIEFITFKSPYPDLETFSLPSYNNEILFNEFKRINNDIDIQQIHADYERYIDLFLLKHYKSFLSKADKKNISRNSLDQDNRAN